MYYLGEEKRSEQPNVFTWCNAQLRTMYGSMASAAVVGATVAGAAAVGSVVFGAAEVCVTSGVLYGAVLVQQWLV